jgi:hypothetical protein
MSQRYRDKRERYVMLRFWLLNYPHGRACRQRHAPSTSRWSSEQRPNRHDGPRRCQAYWRQQRQWCTQ